MEGEGRGELVKGRDERKRMNVQMYVRRWTEVDRLHPDVWGCTANCYLLVVDNRNWLLELTNPANPSILCISSMAYVTYNASSQS